MVGVSISDALAKIQAPQLKNRKDGLSDLKYVLEHNRRNTSSKALNDRNYNELLKELFDIIRTERSNFLKSSRPNEDRLSTCADALRIIVENGVKSFRRKHSAPNLLSHIQLTLPVSDGQLLEPIAKQYAKALRIFLEYRPHAEHLLKEEWRELISLCLRGVKSRSNDPEEDWEDIPSASASGKKPGGGSRSATPSSVNVSFRSSKKPLKKPFVGIADQTLEDLFVCLSLLLSVPHFPVLDISGEVYLKLCQFLEDSGPTAHMQSMESIFCSLNAILSYIITEDLFLSKKIAQKVLPQVRRLWHSKTHQKLKEQMLLFVGQCESLLQSTLAEDLDFRYEVERLIDVLQSEYVKRKEIDLLSFDDLILRCSELNKTFLPMSNLLFQLRLGSSRGEQTWTLLSCTAKMIKLVEDSKDRISRPQEGHSIVSNKRRKTEGWLDIIIRSIKTTSGFEKVACLQVLAFVCLESHLKPIKSQKVWEAIFPMISREDSGISAWALLVLACVCERTDVSNPDTEHDGWIQCWKLAARAVTSPSTCRPACHLMVCLLRHDVIGYQEVNSTTDSMLASVDLSGPALFCDSSVLLWCSLLQTKARHAPALVYYASQKISSWFFVRWRPSAILDSTGSKSPLVYDTEDIVALMIALLGLPSTVAPSSLEQGRGPLAEAQARQFADFPLLSFLLQIQDPSSTLLQMPLEEDNESAIVEFSDARFQTLCKEILEFFGDQVRLILSTEVLNSSASSKIGDDFLLTLAQLGIVVLSLISNARVQKLTKISKLNQDVNNLKQRITDIILKQEDNIPIITGLLQAFSSLLTFGSRDVASSGARNFASSFGPNFWQKVSTHEDDAVGDDLLNVEDSIDSQNSRARSDTQDTNQSRKAPRSAAGIQSHRTNRVARICLASLTKLAPRDSFSGTCVPDGFFDYVTQLGAQEFLYCRSVFLDLFKAKASISSTSALVVLEYVGKELLESNEFERNETALSTTLEIMTGLAEVWIGAEGDLQDIASQLYKWFITAALPWRILPPRSLICMANLLQKVLELRPDYARDLSVESTRTSLFRIFEEGTAKVKYYIGTRISSIFNFFILKEHDAILDDVLSSLPLEPDWIEGSALRIYILARLGASWSTLLRRCIYAIAEAPVLVPACSKYAEKCFTKLANDLNIDLTRDLFRLFASQIIYTWLDTRGLNTIPFKVFGYVSLENLLLDVQIEVSAQVVMRGREAEAGELSQYCQQSIQHLVKTAFGRAAAYCIARDASIPPDADEQAARGAVRLKNIVGKEQFGKLLKEEFPIILASLFKSADREESISRGFQKYDTFSAASQAYDEILSSGASQAQLTVSQQPSFKASYLLDEIDWLCARSQVELETMWSPTLYVYVFRELLDSLHPALGSLHTCSIIRRLRILVSMAGETALEGYPLETALHSLRRFVVDTQCAEDVVGLFKYLISHGFPYLQKVPSFFTGYVVSTLVSLRAFLESPRDSTTQESQYIATMSKAKEFHEWLGTRMKEYQAPQLSSFETETLRQIVDKAVQIRVAGNSRVDTPEGDLLSMILEDHHSGRKLVNHSSRSLILDVLCSEFEFTPNFRDDILGNEESAARCAPVLLSTIPQGKVKPAYTKWVSRVLGRAYAGIGQFSWKSLHHEMTAILPTSTLPATHPSNESRSAILQFLKTRLYIDNLQEVSKVERALQEIFASTKRKDPLFDCLEDFSRPLLSALSWTRFPYPQRHSPTRRNERTTDLAGALRIKQNEPYSAWIKNLSLALALTCPNEPLLSGIVPILESIEGVPEQLFPQILHLALTFSTGKQEVKRVASSAAGDWLNEFDVSFRPQIQQLFKAVHYLRTQEIQGENTKSDRVHWLELDYRSAAEAAARCGMHTTSLLFLEISLSETPQTASRRSSTAKRSLPVELLLQIYQNVDDQDSFYGIRQPSNLRAMMNQLEFENAGFKSLSFRGAYYESQIKHVGSPDRVSEEEMVKLLDAVELNGVSQALLSTAADQASLAQEAMFTTARKLERWDITGPPDATSPSVILFKAFQNIHDSADYASLTTALDSGFSKILSGVLYDSLSARELKSYIITLAVLTEIEDVVSSNDVPQLLEAWERLHKREDWMLLHRYEDVKIIDSCRQTLFSTISKSKDLRSLMKVSEKDARVVEVRAMLASSGLNRRHGALQSCLNSATYLAQLVDSCAELGLCIDVAANFEASNVLWDQGEMASSIRMLQDITRHGQIKDQDICVGKPQILATLGHRMSEARLEKPDEIIANYLGPAIEELEGNPSGSEAGQVFHEFASFCDQQLKNPNTLEDFKRIEILRARKESEVNHLDSMVKSVGSQTNEKKVLKSMQGKAKKFFDLDDQEYQRLRKERKSLLRQSLENYLLCLGASDEYDSDALRFSALWLEYSDEEVANEAVRRQIQHVPSRKFAPLINQWTSRQLNIVNEFQKLLADLIFRICCDHPYHGMYQIFTSTKSKGSKDQMAISRVDAATKVVNELKKHKRTSSTWIAIHNTNVNFVRFASETFEKAKQGSKVQLAHLNSGQRLEQDARINRIPPPTMKIPLRADCDYSSIVTIHSYVPYFTYASGISVPKVVTAVGSDNKKYKQLFKSGNDDLRQDAIMEQVFEQVSNLLRHHRDARQRNLGIRSYKVLPLTANAGIIEWVMDTVPLNDYLMPAHQAHYPRDLKQAGCRKPIQDAQENQRSKETRIKVFRDVCEKFHPVLRYFLMERFPDPDEWFQKRLAYTRSTAAISMLGYILGLGDRHGQNILLDEKTGEVVHIDLGVAFEAGRVLPVPEVVPFRLTRDIVDGMGITKTEGVFRRCCEFTLDALRREEHSIMTILDVLRYDPLVSWSVSPLKMKKLQKNEDVLEEDEEESRLRAQREATKAAEHKSEEGEADRALTVVRKKLSKSLSVAATVNELIQEASDERNLALLFAGWAAYA